MRRHRSRCSNLRTPPQYLLAAFDQHVVAAAPRIARSLASLLRINPAHLSHTSLPRCSARRIGVLCCLALLCQLVTERMTPVPIIRSETSTFQAPSRAARRRCLDAHSSNGSTSFALPAPAAAAVADRSPMSTIQA